MNTIRDKNQKRGREIVFRAPQLYIDLDIEADGKPGYGSIRSIGAVSVGGEEFYRELKPSSDRWIPSQHEFCEQHGLQRERLMEEGVDPKEALSDLSDWQATITAKSNKNESIITAFNASFDYPFVDLAYLENGIKNPFGVAGYCIKSLAIALDPKKCDWDKTSKRKLPKDVLPDGDFTHHALEDAKYQQKLHYGLVGKLAWREANREEAHKNLAELLAKTKAKRSKQTCYGHLTPYDGGFEETFFEDCPVYNI